MAHQVETPESEYQNRRLRLPAMATRIAQARESGILLFLLALCVVIGIVNPIFLSAENLANILRTTSFIFLMAIAMTFVLISGGLDLSVASVFALGGVVASMAVTHGWGVVLSVLAGLFVGLVVGVLNGVLVIKFSIPALIVTLGTMYMVRGVVLIVTQGVAIYPLTPEFNTLGQGDLLGIPYVILIAIVLAVIAHVVLNYTAYGRSIYAIGGNEETSRLAGISTKFLKGSVYVLSGLAAALSGLIMAGRLNSAQPNVGSGYELLVIAGVIIGGTSLFGGAGTILGTVAGTLLTSVIANGIVLMKISAYWQNLIVGAVIIVAVGLDQYRRKRSGLL
jgi:ribose/xylose/arabinose/galactoside ABC-type transport system permease subunit